MKLYSTYVLWANYYGKNKIDITNGVKELKKLGYENDRENVPGYNCNKKVTKWVDIRIRSDMQDRLIPKNYDKPVLFIQNYWMAKKQTWDRQDRLFSIPNLV